MYCTSRVKRLAAAAGVATFSIAVHQANGLRQSYKDSVKLFPPTGPNSGSENFATKLNRFKETLIDEKDDVLQKTKAMLRDLKLKVSNHIENTESTIENARTNTDKIKEKLMKKFMEVSGRGNAPTKAPRKLKLVVLGDSLVCGVGCDSEESPVLPKIVAKVLSIALQADVEWCSLGIIGGTVNEIRSSLLPDVRKKLEQSCNGSQGKHQEGNKCREMDREGGKGEKGEKHGNKSIIKNQSNDKGKENSAEDVEIIVVLICGLNDWKLLVEQFPYGPGPATYRNELRLLVEDIKEMGGDFSSKCKVFLPAMPLVCGKGDPNYVLGVAPLSYFVDFVSFVWDLQKRSVALDMNSTVFIAAPDNLAKCYATPGRGNFSLDGVHPSSQGYKWWAFHIAEEILCSKQIDI